MNAGGAVSYEYVDDLCIITTYFNSHGYQTKLTNYERFIDPIRSSGLKSVVVECAFGDAPFQLTPSPGTIQVRAKDVLWQKERLLNVAVAHVPAACTKVAWLDCDIIFRNPEWAVETSDLLERARVVQPFTTAVRLPKDRQFSVPGDRFFASFCARRPPAWDVSVSPFAAAAAVAVEPASVTEIAYCVVCGSRTTVVHDCKCTAAQAAGTSTLEMGTGLLMLPTGEFQKHGHTGFAWAARKELLVDIGLYDVSLSGTGDHLIAHAVCGDWTSPCIPRLLGENEKQMAHYLAWAERMFRNTRGNVACVTGQIDHLWHGDDENRNYKQRGWELAAFDFDPAVDLRIGSNQCWEWNSQKPDLHHWCLTYFGLRKEDG